MTYQIEESNGYTLVHLQGEVDLNHSPAVRKVILDCLQEDIDLMVDLSAVTYIDSSGIATLVEGYQISRQRSLDFALIGVSEVALSVLRLARLDTVFPIFASPQARLAAKS